MCAASSHAWLGSCVISALCCGWWCFQCRLSPSLSELKTCGSWLHVVCLNEMKSCLSQSLLFLQICQCFLCVVCNYAYVCSASTYLQTEAWSGLATFTCMHAHMCDACFLFAEEYKLLWDEQSSACKWPGCSEKLATSVAFGK